MMYPENLFILTLAAVPITLIDLREQRVPDVLSLGGLLVLSAASLIRGIDPFLDFLIAVVIGAGVFLLVRLATGRKLGLGDVKYSALIAGALGIPGWLLAVFLSSFVGLVFAVIAIRSGKMKPEAKIAFAPFMTVGAACSMGIRIFLPALFIMLSGGSG